MLKLSPWLKRWVTLNWNASYQVLPRGAPETPFKPNRPKIGDTLGPY